MHLDLDKMNEIVYGQYLTAIVKEYGNEGTSQLRKMFQGIRRLYHYVAPETITDALVIFRSLQDDNDIPTFSEKAQYFTYEEHLAQEYDAANRKGTTVIQILSNDEYRLWRNAAIDLNTLSNSAIVYIYRRRQDYIIVRGEEKAIVNPSRSHASIFAVPTFRELEDALEDYKRRMIRTSQCKIFSQAWDGGENSDRLFFANEPKPEAIMRNSLWQYLTSVLGAEVRPEQIVDESHPCDIKVTWMQTNRIALIEIKWLGKSIDKNRRRFTQDHSEARAREGADQLADYLDANRTQTPTHQTRGYLVVIDARRWRLTLTSTSVNKRNGFWYKDKDIVFDPEYHKERSDFMKPIRMFAEPRCRPD